MLYEMNAKQLAEETLEMLSHKIKILQDKYKIVPGLAVIKIGNDPASVITSLIKDGVMGLYCASTLVGYRNSGICTALLNHALNEGRLEHCHSCVYQSANPAIVNHVSKKFGFREYGHLLQLRYSV